MDKILRDIQLLGESIEHWQRDIEAPLLAGDTVSDDRWDSNGEEVKMFVDSCPLCKEYGEDGCCGCPLGDNDNYCDDGSTWDTFHDNPTLDNCRAMIASLRRHKSELEQQLIAPGCADVGL